MTGYGKRGKPEAGFPSFPTALGNRKSGDSHIPTAPMTTAVEKWKSQSRISTFPLRLPLYMKNEERRTRLNAG
jgi:hypothetical protein